MAKLRERMNGEDERYKFWMERQQLLDKSPLVIDKNLPPDFVMRLHSASSQYL